MTSADWYASPEDSMSPEIAWRALEEYETQVAPSEEGDPDGKWALQIGATCYRMAMNCADSETHNLRIACFQAAEYLYRVAAQKGHLFGYVNLGYIYYYDRCEGQYYPDFRENPKSEAALRYQKAFDVDKEAYRYYHMAAQKGEAQSCYKVGDLLKHGRGCAKNLALAFQWYKRAYEQGKDDYPETWGSAALRLGDCYENGLGTDPDFERALHWYKIAEDGLDRAVRAGDSWFEKSFHGARDGALRCAQELNGEY